MPTLLLQAHSSDSSGETNGFDAALVTLTPAGARTLLARLELVARLHEQCAACVEVSFTDFAPVWVADFSESLTEAQRDVFDVTGILELPDDFTPPEASDDEHPSECDALVVTHSGVATWECCPEHDDLKITTESVPRAVLERLAKRAAPAARTVTVFEPIWAEREVELPITCPDKTCGADLRADHAVVEVDFADRDAFRCTVGDEGVVDVGPGTPGGEESLPTDYLCAACGESLTRVAAIGSAA